jgi:hypothetical protein
MSRNNNNNNNNNNNSHHHYTFFISVLPTSPRPLPVTIIYYCFLTAINLHDLSSSSCEDDLYKNSNYDRRSSGMLSNAV